MKGPPASWTASISRSNLGRSPSFRQSIIAPTSSIGGQRTCRSTPSDAASKLSPTPGQPLGVRLARRGVWRATAPPREPFLCSRPCKDHVRRKGRRLRIYLPERIDQRRLPRLPRHQDDSHPYERLEKTSRRRGRQGRTLLCRRLVG